MVNIKLFFQTSTLPDWMDDKFIEKHNLVDKVIDEDKLRNLNKRRLTYSDICQNVTERQLRNLLLKHNNRVPDVIYDIDDWVRQKGSQTYIPPGFFDRNGIWLQPPSFEMSLNKR